MFSIAASDLTDLADASAGDIETLLETYDRDRLALPSPYSDGWKWGWTKSAEVWNGRIAMIAIIFILSLEVITGQGVLSALRL